MFAGCRSVAERCLHDFFHNARKMVVNVLRVRLFGLFVGMVEGEKDIKHSALLQVRASVLPPAVPPHVLLLLLSH